MRERPQQATLLHGGTIRTLDPGSPRVEQLLVEGGRVAGGARSGRDVARVDLQGACVLPGFSDSHAHFATWALARGTLRLEGTWSSTDAVARVAEVVPAVSPGQWLLGYGWRQGDWGPGDAPTRAALDMVTNDVPVALTSKDYHSLWLNSAALARADGDLHAPGGEVELDESGRPTGLLREAAAWRFRDRFVEVSDEQWLDAMRAGVGVANARGVTAIHDKDGWLGSLGLWQRLHREGPPRLRVWQSLPADRLDAVEAAGLRAGLGDDYLRAGYLKAFADGTLGSDTALMHDGRGIRVMGRDELEDVVRRAARAGWPVAVHAIGDLANHEVLDAFAATRSEWAARGLRPRVEHAQCLDPADIPRFARLGVACSVQFSHAPSDRDLADAHWAGLTQGAYAYRSLWNSGAVVANGSDAPVEELDPLLGVRAAVLRTLDERPAWHPEEALTVEQALCATTVLPAWLCHDEGRRGRLAAGFLADLVVLDRDPLECPVDELGTIEVTATMVGGRWVHGAPGAGRGRRDAT
jgi:predicted amidohydrolase YtcJ